MTDVSSNGLIVHVIASETLPTGFPITNFADDGDSIDVPATPLADKAMGPNGDLVTWAKASPVNLTINIIPNSLEDRLMSLIANANRAGKGKQSANDIITVIAYFPSGSVHTYANGRITDSSPGNSATSAGRMKSKPYTFTFENSVGV